MKIIRTITYFADQPSDALLNRCRQLQQRFESAGYTIQTLRFCPRQMTMRQIAQDWAAPDFFWSLGTLDLASAFAQMDDFLAVDYPVFFNIELKDRPEKAAIDYWWQLARSKADRTFRYSYTFSNCEDTPFYPAARSQKTGFAIGLQTPDLATVSAYPAQWKQQMRDTWAEVMAIVGSEPDFLGIDSSIAPMGNAEGSIARHIQRWYGDWETAVLSDFFCNFSHFIKTENPMPTGICGWFFPCLEDGGLAELYEQGQFSTERNLFLSLHCASGIDTYPVGMDESEDRMLRVLQLIWALATKYRKPLSVRWVSDGITRIGERTQLNNRFLHEVVVRGI